MKVTIEKLPKNNTIRLAIRTGPSLPFLNGRLVQYAMVRKIKNGRLGPQLVWVKYRLTFSE